MLRFLPTPIILLLGLACLGYGIYQLVTSQYLWGVIFVLGGAWILSRGYAKYQKNQGKPKKKNYDE
jgi:ABC-type uncharacterized transport system permease subunit